MYMLPRGAYKAFYFRVTVVGGRCKRLFLYATQKRRVVLSFVKACATSGIAFFSAAVSILAVLSATVVPLPCDYSISYG